MSTAAPPRAGTREWLQPFFLAVPFVIIIQGLGLKEFLPVPVALLLGAGWGIAISLITTWIRTTAALSGWCEDVLVGLGTVAMAFSACGGVLGFAMIKSALGSSSLSGETLLAMFVPSIPYYIIVNSSLELLIVPALLILGWRPGKRRVLIVVAAALFFVQRVWSYLVFVSARMDFAEQARSVAPLTAAQRQQAYTDLMLDDPRWILNLIILAVFLLAAYLPRFRELSAATVPAEAEARHS